MKMAAHLEKEDDETSDEGFYTNMSNPVVWTHVYLFDAHSRFSWLAIADLPSLVTKQLRLWLQGGISHYQRDRKFRVCYGEEVRVFAKVQQGKTDI